MSDPIYTVTLTVRVHDLTNLVSAAVISAQADGCTYSEAYQALHYEDGKVDIRGCLAQVLDPGMAPGVEILSNEVNRA